MHSTHFVYAFSKLSETFIYDYVTSLQSQEIGVNIITFNHLNKEERPFKPVTTLSVPWWNIPRIRNKVRDILRGRNTETSSWPVYRGRLYNMFLENKPDILHAHFGPMGVLLAPVAEKLNIPLVVTFYGYDISEIIRYEYWQESYKELAETADCITVLSEEMRERARNIGFKDDQLEIVHLGTKINEITYQEPSYPITQFLSIGRLAEKKGHLDTLKAFHTVLRTTEDPLQLSIIGDGPDRPHIESYIRSKGLQENVSIVGSLPHSKVIEYLYQADAFVLSSKTASNGDREGTPTVLIEAQAAGLPCISTFHAGIPEIIPAENHRLLAEEGNLSQIIATMQKLLESSEEEVKEISRLGRKQVEEAFDVTREAEKFIKIYKKCINR